MYVTNTRRFSIAPEEPNGENVCAIKYEKIKTSVKSILPLFDKCLFFYKLLLACQHLFNISIIKNAQGCQLEARLPPHETQN